MKCPSCGKEADIPDRCQLHADHYGKTSIVRTDCCQSLVRLIPIRSFRLEKYEGPKTEDDWGE